MDQIRIVLIKLGHALDAPFDRQRGCLQPRWRERKFLVSLPVVEKVGSRKKRSGRGTAGAIGRIRMWNRQGRRVKTGQESRFDHELWLVRAAPRSLRVFPVESVTLERGSVERGWLSTPTKEGSIEKKLVRLLPSSQIRTMVGLREG